MAQNIRRAAAALVITVGLVGLGGGVAFADDGTIQDVGHSVQGVEKSTGVEQTSKEIDDSTGVTTIDDETGVTGVEEGAGLE